ncbi:hypothetical protein BCL76_101626 [Streptomyces sp. CG 926]|uniref:hypothetical protein n=1 Tax=Streptomyces sp. CG 926 TaxID=1882405 RepID=UPI000D794A55|nr:hypothetical protein [Streptomyces sp. CG 926]PWK74892.1 hypothetical protein BCL76_101626 [Streptomyces sp. CG 926]
MGKSRAYPVDRTTDPFDAYRRARARALCAPPARQDEEIRLGAELRTVQDVRRTAAVLPGLRHQHPDARVDPATGEYRRFEPDVSTADDAEPAYDGVQVVFNSDRDRRAGAGRTGDRWVRCRRVRHQRGRRAATTAQATASGSSAPAASSSAIP